MWTQFFLENAHFAIYLFTALVSFAVFWLYFDAWRPNKTVQQAPLIFGWLFLSLGFVVLATEMETTVVSSPFFGVGITREIGEGLLLLGFLAQLLGLFGEALQPTPSKESRASLVPLFLATSLPVAGVLAAFAYMRRATVGLEHHLKPVSYAIFLMALSFLFSQATLFRGTTNVSLFSWVIPFGPLWLIQNGFLLAAGILLGRWVFGYLLKQFETQLFMFFTSAILLIFLITTITFSGLLLKNIEDESLRQLSTDVRVLQMALESKKAESISDASLLAQNPALAAELEAANRTTLNNLAGEFLLAKKLSTLVIVSEGGQVLARGEDRERNGEVIADDPLIKRALLGESVASMELKEGVVSPQILLLAAVPVKNGDAVAGAVMLGTFIDSAFVDGLKTATGLEASIYGGNQIAATTFTGPDGLNRLVGLKEETTVIKKRVLGDAATYSGSVTVAQTLHLASYLPLLDADATPIGMLFVGRPQLSVLQTAGRSIELTFMVAALLLIVSVFPSYFIARYMAAQLD